MPAFLVIFKSLTTFRRNKPGNYATTATPHLLLSFAALQAQTYWGASLEYSQQTSDTVAVELTLWVDCQGQASNPGALAVRDTNLQILATFPLQFLDSADVTPISGPSACRGGSSPYGIRQERYEALVPLTSLSPCHLLFTWQGDHRLRYRQSASQEGLYIEALLNQCAGMNTTPQFQTKPRFLISTYELVSWLPSRLREVSQPYLRDTDTFYVKLVLCETEGGKD